MIRIGESIRIIKMGLTGTNRFRLFIHHLYKPAVTAARRFRCHYRRIISGNQHHAIQQLMQRNRLSRSNAYQGSILMHRKRSNHCLLLQFIMPFLQRNNAGKHLRCACRIDFQISVFVCQCYILISPEQRC